VSLVFRQPDFATPSEISPQSDESYRCAMSLRSELRSVETLLKVSKKCLCPKLKTYADELYKRKVKLKDELKIRSEEKKLCA
jgi:hypothetical protein